MNMPKHNSHTPSPKATFGPSPLLQPLSETAAQQVQGGYWAHYAPAAYSTAAQTVYQGYQGYQAHTAADTSPPAVSDWYPSTYHHSTDYSHQTAANHLDQMLLG